MSLLDRPQKPETPIDNVLYMRDFVESKMIAAEIEQKRLTDKAEELSNQKKDKFAAPLRKKAEEFGEKVEKWKNQLKFIDKGGNVVPVSAPASVYRFNFPANPGLWPTRWR